MIKVILFDCDGPIIKRAKYFSQRLKEERGIVADTQDQTSFFTNEFLLCEKGKADLKIELEKRLPTWGWDGSAEELMDYWFKGEAEVGQIMKSWIEEIRKRDIKCYLSTNNEKYRVDYLWNKARLKDFLDGKFASSELGFLKSETEFWQKAYKMLSPVNKAEVLVIDDDESAVTTAKQFGFQAEHYTDFENFLSTIKSKYQL